jgi:transposase-like protein
MFLTTIRLADVRRLLQRSRELELSAQAVQKLKWFAFALEHDGNVSLACRHFGIARSTFMRWAERFDARDPLSLEENSKRPHNVRVSDINRETVEIIRHLRMKNPVMGKVQIQQILKDKHGITLSSSTVGRVIARHAMFFGDLPSHVRKRGGTSLQTETSERIPDVRDVPEENTGHTGFLPLTPDSGLLS